MRERILSKKSLSLEHRSGKINTSVFVTKQFTPKITLRRALRKELVPMRALERSFTYAIVSIASLLVFKLHEKHAELHKHEGEWSVRKDLQ